MSEVNMQHKTESNALTVAELMYKVKMAFWLFLRALKKRINFKLMCNVDNFQHVDFQYEENGKLKTISLRLKHTKDEALDEQFLTSDFLYKCFKSYNTILKTAGEEMEPPAKKIKKQAESVFKDELDDLHFVIFTNGKLPANDRLLKTHKNHSLNEYLNIDLYSYMGNKPAYFHEDYYQKCICQLFKGNASDVLETNSQVKAYFVKEFKTNDNTKIVSQIKNLTEEKVTEILKQFKVYEEYEKFLAEVVLFHDEPNIKEMDAFIIDEIRDLSDFDPNEVYNELLQYFADWHDNSNIILTKNNYCQVFEEYSKPNTKLRKYFDNQLYISRELYKNGDESNTFVINNVEDITDKSPMIIAGAAGMGKTSFINSIFQLNPKNLWILKITLNDPDKTPKYYIEGEFGLLQKCIPYINKTKSDFVLRLVFERKLLILVDGFGQIDQLNESITTFFKFLSDNCYLIVTIPTHSVQKLTKELRGNLFYLQKFNEKDCILYVRNQCDLENKEKIVDKLELIFKNDKSFLKNFILETPLHLKMYLEYIKNHLDENETENIGNSLYTIYKSFVDEKIEVYLSRTQYVSKNHPSFITLKDNIMQAHKYYAHELLKNPFDDYEDVDEDEELVAELEPNLSKKVLFEIGLIDYFDRKEQAHFVLDTFAQYFYAIHLSEHLGIDKYELIIWDKVKANNFLGKMINAKIINDSAKRFHIIDDDIELFKKNKYFNQIDDFGRTSLHLAFGVGAIKIATFLVNEDSYQCETDLIKGDTQLHLIIENKIKLEEDLMRKVIKKCGVNCINNARNTPLHVAAEHDFPEVVDLLMNNIDCNVNMKNVEGNTPLLEATKHNRTEIVAKLLTHDKCDPNLYNKDEKSALLLAAENGYKNVMELLIESKKLKTNYLNKAKNTPLHVAAFYHQADIVKLLLEKEFNDINSFDSKQLTPLYYAVDEGHVEVVKILLSYDDCKCDVYEECSINNASYIINTLIHRAIERNHIEIVKLLINHKNCNLNVVSYNHGPPLHLAFCLNRSEIIDLLIENTKYDINCADHNDDAPLHIIMDYNNYLELYNERKNIYSTKKFSQTPRFLYSDQFETVELEYDQMIESIIGREDCDLNCVNKNKDTPLHIAVRDKSIFAVDLLINNSKCELNCKDKNGETPMMIAKAKGFTDIIKLLEEKKQKGQKGKLRRKN